MDLHGRRVVVVGLGASGRAAAALCAARGARVTGVDLRESIDPIEGVELELGPHRRETFLGADQIIVSPGVPSSQPDLRAADARGVPILGELGLAAALLGEVPILGVTGTNGKSTVTSLCGQLLRAAGLKVFIGGNLGDPLCGALPRQPGPAPFELAVVECSSYQLERAGELRPLAGTLLNLTPDHLARHGNLQAYADAKLRLFAHQRAGDLALLPADNPLVLGRSKGIGKGFRALIGAEPGVRLEGAVARIRLPGVTLDLDLSDLPIPGVHNRLNAAVAASLALWAGATPLAIRQAIPSLRGLPHRMQIVGEYRHVLWINDSKATNVEAAAVGIAGLDRPAVVLLGGEAKGEGFAALAPSLRDHRGVITFGGSGEAIANELEKAGLRPVRTASLSDAVRHAMDLARSGDAVLLSPGCASFDAFENFEHRGTVFAALVQEVAS
ncbi:MAG: UDP-N-acetylmuramoyl-L-alanine--D-glutamate ligase [Deltaproteobacteria bacterium]|nr:MAG: UDP-N-acetylmuramoyl-L-alanine--D-glutamate ligase [Deltaproteobacteria bacterium]